MIGDWFRRKPLSLNRVPKLDSHSVFILGNGPSLNEHNLEHLEGIPTFASNAIFLIFEKTSWRPDYYSCVDSAVLPDQKEDLSIWARKLKRTKFFFPFQIVTHDSPFTPQNVDEIVLPRKNVCYFDSRPLNLNGGQKQIFSLAEDDFLVEPMTVTITLMQLAVKLGARRLFLIGCDTEYKVPDDATILDQDSPRVDKRIVLDKDEDPNHFDPRYFGKGKVWHTPNPDLMISHYEKAKAICEENGIEIFNAGIGGKLEVFPRISFDEAISACAVSTRTRG